MQRMIVAIVPLAVFLKLVLKACALPWSDEVPEDCYIDLSKAATEADPLDESILDIDPTAKDEDLTVARWSKDSRKTVYPNHLPLTTLLSALLSPIVDSVIAHCSQSDREPLV